MLVSGSNSSYRSVEASGRAVSADAAAGRLKSKMKESSSPGETLALVDSMFDHSPQTGQDAAVTIDNTPYIQNLLHEGTSVDFILSFGQIFLPGAALLHAMLNRTKNSIHRFSYEKQLESLKYIDKVLFQDSLYQNRDSFATDETDDLRYGTMLFLEFFQDLDTKDLEPLINAFQQIMFNWKNLSEAINNKASISQLQNFTIYHDNAFQEITKLINRLKQQIGKVCYSTGLDIDLLQNCKFLKELESVRSGILKNKVTLENIYYPSRESTEISLKTIEAIAYRDFNSDSSEISVELSEDKGDSFYGILADISRIVKTLIENMCKHSKSSDRLEFKAALDDDGNLVIKTKNIGFIHNPENFAINPENSTSESTNTDEATGHKHGTGTTSIKEMLQQQGGDLTAENTDNGYVIVTARIPSQQAK